jgi:uncharacterized membrane protein
MAVVDGKVTDKLTGQGIENATVVIGKSFALTGEYGDYTVSDVTPGEYVVSVLQRYYEKYSFRTTIAGDVTLDIQLIPE